MSTPTLADFQLLKLVGQGSSGRVYRARDTASGQSVALKIVKKGIYSDSRTLLEQHLQQSLSGSPFVLPLLASWHDSANFYLVSPFCGGQDMEHNLSQEGRFSEDRARFYAAELLVALEHLKAERVLHRDVKPANILFTDAGHVRLIDLGLATKLKASPVTHVDFHADPTACSGSFSIQDPDFTSAERVGTPSYMSADQHIGRPYSYEADLHALGVSLYQMLTGRLPFGVGAKSREDMIEAVLCEQLTFKPDDKVSSEARDLLSTLTSRDSRSPAQLEEIKRHPWFSSIRWDRVKTQSLSPSWKPYLSSLPRNNPVIEVDEGVPCSPDPYPGFAYVSPEFLDMRAQRDRGILNRLSRLFSREQLPSSPKSPSSTSPSLSVSPPEVRTEAIQVRTEVTKTLSPPPFSPVLLAPAPSKAAITSSSSSFRAAARRSPPPTPPPTIPLPPIPTAATPKQPADASDARGDLPPLHIRQLLNKRPRQPPPTQPIEVDVPLPPTPEVIITPAEDDVGEAVNDPLPGLREPLRDVSNQRYLSPSDAERPTFTPVLKPGPRIKLSAPPKRAKRAQKENAPLLRAAEESEPKVKVARTPPTAVFMLPPKSVPLPLAMPASAPLQTPKKATAAKAEPAPQPPMKKTVPAKPVSLTSVSPPSALQTPKKATVKAGPAPQPPAKKTVPAKPVKLTSAIPPSTLQTPKKGTVKAEPVSQPSVMKTVPAKPVKSVPLASVSHTAAPTPKRAASKDSSQLSPKTSPPKPATPKVKPAFKVPAKVAESKLGTPPGSVRRRNTLKTSTPPASMCSGDITNDEEAIYPRPMVRADTLSHPALAFADASEKPASYPRPPEGVSHPKTPTPITPLSIAEAFAPPPRSPPGSAPKTTAPAPRFTSAPQACGVLGLSSEAFSPAALAGFYGLTTPRVNLDPKHTKQRAAEILERARAAAARDMRESPYLSTRAAAPPIAVGPHYAGHLPGPSPTGIVSELRRMWIRLSMAVSRAVAWFKYRNAPGFQRY